MTAYTADSTFYLIASRKNSNSYRLNLPRVTQRAPALSAGEVAIRVDLRLPVMLFQRPQLQATIEVASDVVAPPVIDADVIDNIETLLAERLGIEITLTQVEQ